jgi:hypothetical protein
MLSPALKFSSSNFPKHIFADEEHSQRQAISKMIACHPEPVEG